MNWHELGYMRSENWNIRDEMRRNKDEYEEVKNILKRMFSNENFMKNFSPSRPTKVEGGWIYENGTSYKMIDKTGKESELIKSILQKYCTCGCGINEKQEEIWRHSKLKKSREVTLIREYGHFDNKNRLWIKDKWGYNKSVYLIPGFSTEWLKIRFGQ